MLENNFCTCSDFYDTSLVLIMPPKYHTASKWGKKKRKRVFNGNSKNNSQEQEVSWKEKGHSTHYYAKKMDTHC